MIQMKLWQHDCSHSYVVMAKLKRGEKPRMVCVGCGSDVDHTSVLRDAAERHKGAVRV